MNETEHLLTCLGEEGCEIAQDVAKALRFGLEDRNVLNPTGPTNRERLVVELNDLMGVLEMLEERGIIPTPWYSRKLILEKKAKVAKFMEYARGTGALVDAPVIQLGWDKIQAERRRQITVEGYSTDHDDRHQKCELRKAAECYLSDPLMRRFSKGSKTPTGWPWDTWLWKPKPKDRLRELEKAGALFLAEKERLTRRGNYPTARLMEAKAVRCGKKIDRILRDKK